MHSVNSRNAPFGAGNRLSARSPAAVEDMAGTAFRHTNASATVNASVFMRNHDVVGALSEKGTGDTKVLFVSPMTKHGCTPKLAHRTERHGDQTGPTSQLHEHVRQRRRTEEP